MEVSQLILIVLLVAFIVAILEPEWVFSMAFLFIEAIMLGIATVIWFLRMLLVFLADFVICPLIKVPRLFSKTKPQE